MKNIMVFRHIGCAIMATFILCSVANATIIYVPGDSSTIPAGIK